MDTCLAIIIMCPLFVIPVYPCCPYMVWQLVGAAFGAAGQRCMALSTAVFVGEAKEWIPEIIERASKLKVNAGQYDINNNK